MLGDSKGKLLNISPGDDFVIRVLKPEGSEFSGFREIAIKSSIFGDKAPPLSIEVRAKEASSQ